MRTLLLLVAIVILFGFTSCRRHTSLRIENGSPIRFAISGPGLLNVLRVSGPDLEREPNRSGEGERLMVSKIYWEIAPLGTSTRSLDEVGPIVYGKVPPGFVQLQPSGGSPPPLVQGDLYNVTFTVANDNGLNTFFRIYQGRIIAEGQD